MDNSTSKDVLATKNVLSSIDSYLKQYNVSANTPFDRYLGKTWSSNRGSRTVVGVKSHKGELCLQVATNNSIEFIRPVDLDMVIKLDSENLVEKPHEPAFKGISNFLSKLTPDKRAIVKKMLNEVIKFKEHTITRQDLIEQLVLSHGYSVKKFGQDSLVLVNPELQSLEESLTPVGLYYAYYLHST